MLQLDRTRVILKLSSVVLAAALLPPFGRWTIRPAWTSFENFIRPLGMEALWRRA